MFNSTVPYGRLKFDHQFGEIDFDTHLDDFLALKEGINAPVEVCLAELRAWFSDVALDYVKQFMARKDVDKAFEEAIGVLRDKFGQKRETAEELLRPVLKGSAIEQGDLVQMSRFVAKLSKAYKDGERSDRAGEFERTEVHNSIFRKLPHYHEKWVDYRVKREVSEDGKKKIACAFHCVYKFSPPPQFFTLTNSEAR